MNYSCSSEVLAFTSSQSGDAYRCTCAGGGHDLSSLLKQKLFRVRCLLQDTETEMIRSTRQRKCNPPLVVVRPRLSCAELLWRSKFLPASAIKKNQKTTVLIKYKVFNLQVKTVCALLTAKVLKPHWRFNIISRN